jgi:hypothetical protein
VLKSEGFGTNSILSKYRSCHIIAKGAVVSYKQIDLKIFKNDILPSWWLQGQAAKWVSITLSALTVNALLLHYNNACHRITQFSPANSRRNKFCSIQFLVLPHFYGSAGLLPCPMLESKSLHG